MNKIICFKYYFYISNCNCSFIGSKEKIIITKLKNIIKKISFISFILFLSSFHSLCFGEVKLDVNTVLMHSTFKIQGENGVLGTAFIMGRPDSKNPAVLRFVLITADHVFSNMKGEYVILFLRKKVEGKFVKFPFKIKIRQKDKKLWKKHSDADVAIMYVPLPTDIDIKIVSTDLFATNETMIKYEIYPGRELSTLGYPLGLESNKAGFPILRSGKIASFPLIPTEETKIFLLDFEIFSGNSGGPVYYHNPDWKRRGATIIGQTEVQLIMGIVSTQIIHTERIKSFMEVKEQQHQLGLAQIVHASFIKEALELLD